MKNKLYTLFFIIGLSFYSLSYGQNNDIYCLEVKDNGNVKINYSEIGSYAVVTYLYKWNGSIYTQLTSLPASSTSYTDNSSNANNQVVSYYISCESSPSQYNADKTKGTIFLKLFQISETSIRLKWTSLKPLGSEGVKYRIYSRFASGGDWAEIDSTDDLTYLHTISPKCKDTIFYKIELPSSFACTSISNVSGLEVGDSEIPQEPSLLSSSVNLSSQTLTLSWIPSSSLDVLGYVVCKGNPCLPIDTIWGKESNTYACTSCNITNINSISIMAFDTCYNTSLKTPPHKNIVLSYNREPCSSVINLKWSPYEADPIKPISYNLHINNGVEDIVSLLSVTTTHYVFTANPEIETYTFYIEALLDNNDKANSNKITSSQPIPKQVDFAYIRQASIRENNQEVELKFYVDTSLHVNNYRLYRSKGNEDFVLVSKIPYQNIQTFTFIDKPPVSPSEIIYNYKLEVPDECDILYKSSNIISTIKLSIDAKDNDKNLLKWNNAFGWKGVREYKIYRIGGQYPLGVQISSVGNTTLEYEDNISFIPVSSDILSYYVLAIEDDPSPDGQNASSCSSSVKAIKESLVFIPNAFTPLEDFNNIFKPTTYSINADTYLFKILNRWGEVIFETNDVNRGWDGTHKGKLCSTNTYIYIVEFKNSYGKKEKKTGTLSLIY